MESILDFQPLIEYQNALLNLTEIKYTNELDLMKHFFKEDCEISKKLKEKSLNWLHSIECYKTLTKQDFDSVQETLWLSESLRAQGNTIFKSTDQNMDISYKLMKSIQLYTDAIFEAAKGYCLSKKIKGIQDRSNKTGYGKYNVNASIKKFEELLSLGYANRSVVLLKFGYFQEAYDDCFSALEINYPRKEKQYLIILRQIICTNELMQIELMGKHLKELKNNLNSVSTKCRTQIARDIEKYQKIWEEKHENWIDNQEAAMAADHDYRDLQEICYSSINSYGRHLVTRHSMKANEILFKERAVSFSPVNSEKICNQCAKSNFIPIPCKECGGTVVYCSLSCLNQHQDPVHRYECPGFKLLFLQHTGVTLIALHMILDNGLIQMLNIPKEKDNFEKKLNNLNDNNALNPTECYWKDLITCSNDEYYTNFNEFKSYRECLQLIDHLNEMSSTNRAFCAIMSHLIVIYLMNYTDYFQKIENFKNGSMINWPLIVSAIILRHMAQIQVNGYVSSTLVAAPTENNRWGNILNELIWLKAWKLKRGYLHSYGQIGDVAVLNLPFPSLCNHSCEKFFNIKCSGRWITAFAKSDLNARTEITHCYRRDYKQQMRKNRLQELRELYYFNCSCKICKVQCTEEEADREFHEFYQCRCDYQYCKKVFVPKLDDMQWWQESKTPEILCTHCGQRQKLKWWMTFLEFSETNFDDLNFTRSFTFFDELDTFLIGNHHCKAFIATEIIEIIFEIFVKEKKNNHRTHIIERINCKELLKIIRFKMNYEMDKSGQYTLSYIASFTYFWDLIALDCNVQCDKVEMQAMLEILKILSDDERVIFLNYYHDYIKNQIQ